MRRAARIRYTNIEGHRFALPSLQVLEGVAKGVGVAARRGIHHHTTGRGLGDQGIGMGVVSVDISDAAGTRRTAVVFANGGVSRFNRWRIVRPGNGEYHFRRVRLVTVRNLVGEGVGNAVTLVQLLECSLAWVIAVTAVCIDGQSTVATGYNGRTGNGCQVAARLQSARSNAIKRQGTRAFVAVNFAVGIGVSNQVARNRARLVLGRAVRIVKGEDFLNVRQRTRVFYSVNFGVVITKGVVRELQFNADQVLAISRVNKLGTVADALPTLVQASSKIVPSRLGNRITIKIL